MKQNTNKSAEKVSIWTVIRPILQQFVLLAFLWLARSKPDMAAKLCKDSIPFFGWIIMSVVMILQLPKWARWFFGISGFCVVYAMTELFYHSTKAILGGYWVLLMLGYGTLLALTRMIVAIVRYRRAFHK